MAWQHSLVASLTRLYPFYSGCSRVANHWLINRLAPPLSDIVWARAPGGEVLAPLDDFVGRSIYFVGDLDPKITWILRRLLHPGDVALDIGANLGLITILMSRLVGPQGSVHAFEPNPVLGRLIEAARSRNNAGNITLHPLALGSHTAEMDLYIPEGNLGAASLVHHRTGAAVQRVRVMKLDDVACQKTIDRIALIKLDVEGFELDVLKGARNILMEAGPVVIFESNETRQQITPVMDFLRDCKYELLAIPRRLVRMSTRPIDFERPQDIRGHDIVAAPSGDSFRRLCRSLRAE